MKLLPSLLPFLLVACGRGEPSPRSPQQRAEDSAPAITALRASKFPAAAQHAGTALRVDPRNAQAAAVRAIATYQQATHTLVRELGRIASMGETLKVLDHTAGRAIWQAWLDKLAAIDQDLQVVAGDPAFSLEVCLACWEVDWDFDDRIDEGDRRMLEIEYLPSGDEVPENDPRRRPTFRFDVGDAAWARAMLSFQRAVGELVLAYQWTQLDRLFGRDEVASITITLADKARVQRARELVLAGLDHAAKCRAQYLAETDDDREWVPSPRQKSHGVPLEVDDRLYQTWSDVLGDVRRLLRSEEGLSIREVATILGDDAAKLVPDAYLDLGAMLAQPANITVDFAALDGGPSPAAIEKLLRGVAGNGYKAAGSMKPSPLTSRARKMFEELTRGEDTVERKLRYMLWLN